MGSTFTSIHGSSFHVEWPERQFATRPLGWGLVVEGYRRAGYDGPWNWVHAALPLVGVSVAGLFVRLQLRKVWVLFDSGDNPRVKVSISMCGSRAAGDA